MFRNLNALQEFDITNFNTSKVEDMSYLFYNDFGLKKIYTL
jgi:surface protein